MSVIKQGLASIQTQDWDTRVVLLNAVTVIEQELAKVPAPASKKK